MEDDIWIAVWLPINNPLLQEDGLARYGDFVQLAGKRLAEHGLGYFEAAMTGSSNVNLSFTLDPTADAKKAVDLVVGALKTCGYDREAVVTHSGFLSRGGEHSHFERAVWPPGFSGELPR